MENGFIAQENCFVGPAGRNNGRKNSMNSGATLSLEVTRLNTASRPLQPLSPLMDKDGPRLPADRMNRSPGPADSVERRATFRVLVRSDPFLNKG